jgi:hypothetical protein
MKHYKVEVCINDDHPDATEDLIHVLDIYNIVAHALDGYSGHYISVGHGLVSLDDTVEEFARELRAAIVEVNRWPPKMTVMMWEVTLDPTFTFYEGEHFVPPGECEET